MKPWGARMTAYHSPLRNSVKNAPHEDAAQPRVEGLRVLLRVPDVTLAPSSHVDESDHAAPPTSGAVSSNPAAALAALASSLRTTTEQLQADAVQVSAGPKTAMTDALRDASLATRTAPAAPPGPSEPTAVVRWTAFQLWLRTTTGRWFEPQSLISIAVVLCICSIAAMLIGRQNRGQATRSGPPDNTANVPAEMAPPPVAMGEPSAGLPIPPDDLMQVPADMPAALPSAVTTAPPGNESPTVAAVGPAWELAGATAPTAGEAPVGRPWSSQAAVANSPASVPDYQPQASVQAPSGWVNVWPDQDHVERLPPLSAAPNSPGSTTPLPTRNGPDGVLRNRFAEPRNDARAATPPPPRRTTEFTAQRQDAFANEPAFVGRPGDLPTVEMTAQPPAARITRITPLTEAEPGAAP